ncbi:uncharacterized protein LOC130624360 isoform X2 [Hydractinia symbiolongicarpus]|uniref:uncharacterized protein LOC130624360 isoform X2 n=1 Tax=Hydractinia symbiolongicarpus TaxID=13093 RepID=UPI00254EDD5E|nr:uncharacterized protein LOC130624360 isoform X2 [Hydractinia symbiolongicarpus]
MKLFFLLVTCLVVCSAYEQEEDEFRVDFSDPESVSNALQDDRFQEELTEDEKGIFNKMSKDELAELLNHDEDEDDFDMLSEDKEMEDPGWGRRRRRRSSRRRRRRGWLRKTAKKVGKFIKKHGKVIKGAVKKLRKKIHTCCNTYGSKCYGKWYCFAGHQRG